MIPQRIASQLKVWFPSGVGISVAEIRSDFLLYPEEESCVAGAVPKRRSEFSTGRWCAREALRALDILPCPIPMGSRRGPIWPAQTTGSITHTSATCAAIAGRLKDYSGLGIDLVEISAAEPILAASKEVVFNADEDPTPLCFSAKESVIKAVSARVDRWMEFTDVLLTFQGGGFQASVIGLPTPVAGWWARFDDLILTVAAIRSL